MAGYNRPGVSGSEYPDFDANEQRGASFNILEGALNGSDANVLSGWKSITAAYNLQTNSGDFSGGSGCCRGAAYMNFYLALSNHALNFLLQSPYAQKSPSGSSLTYQQLILGTGSGDYGLLPKIMAAMDFMVNTSTHGSRDPLAGDYYSPNRTMINAVMYGFGYQLLQSYPPAQAAMNSTGTHLDNYRSQALWWINNEFVQSASFSRPLMDRDNGIYWEGDTANGYGYDTSYQGVGTLLTAWYAYNFPNDILATGLNPLKVVKLNGRFLQQRMLANDPTGATSNAGVDVTDNTRTGTIYAEAGKTTDYDYTSGSLALTYYTALFNRPEGVASAYAHRKPAYFTLVDNLPPMIFNDPDLLTVTLTHNVAMPAYTVYGTNSGIRATGMETLDPQYVISATGLPAGLTLGPVYSYAAGLQLDQIIGMADITGIPTTAGTYTVILQARNKFGAGPSTALTIRVQ
ncbi:MAG TPA: hypothetical protein VGB94_12045 [Acidobacteriaceae bacterium]